jgi:hypothetical protein
MRSERLTSTDPMQSLIYVFPPSQPTFVTDIFRSGHGLDQQSLFDFLVPISLSGLASWMFVLHRASFSKAAT